MQANTGPALFVVAQDLKLDREVDLANADASRHDKYHRGEIENARHACAHEAIGGVLGSAWRRRDDADVDPPGMHDLGEVLDVTNPHSTDHTADLGGLDVDDTGHRETPFAEASVAGERLTEVARPDDDDRPVVGETEFAPDLINEERDLVADTSRTVAAEVGEVLADLGGVDARKFGETFAADPLHLFVGLLDEDPQVYRKTDDGGVWNSSADSFNWHELHTLCTRAYIHKAGRKRTGEIRMCISSRSRPAIPISRQWRRGVTLNAGLAAAATLVAVAFALSTLDRWQRRRREHELAWTISLTLFALGGMSLWWAESHGWGTTVFRLFFLTGAVLNVPWLALGTVYLLAGPQWGRRVRTWLIGLSGLAAGIVAFSPTKVGVSGTELPQGSQVFGVAPRVLAAVGSGVPALVIVVGALWSAVRVGRGRVPAFGNHAQRTVTGARRLALGNILIAAGTLILSASGTIAGRLGKDRAFALTLLIGVAVLFVGFLVASSGATPRLAATTSHQRAA